MKIKVVFQPGSPLRNKIKNTYTCLYKQFKNENPHDKTYTRKKLRQNISNVLSVGRIFVDESSLRQPQYNPWVQSGWIEIPSYRHWHFAVVKKIDKRGRTFFEIQDCVYEGDYHNDTMQTQPYNESKVIRISETILKQIIIMESIKKVLNVI